MPIKIEDNVPVPTAGRGVGGEYYDALEAMTPGQSFVVEPAHRRAASNAVARWHKDNNKAGKPGRAVVRNVKGEGEMRIWRME